MDGIASAAIDPIMAPVESGISQTVGSPSGNLNGNGNGNGNSAGNGNSGNGDNNGNGSWSNE